METSLLRIKLLNHNEDTKLYNLLLNKTSKNNSFYLSEILKENLLFPSASMGFKVVYNKSGYTRCVEYEVTKFDWQNNSDVKSFFDDVVDILDKTIQRVPNLATRFGQETIKDKDLCFYQSANENHVASVYSLLYFVFEEKIKNGEEYGVLDFAIDIFIRLANTQHLPNGNKRNAVLFLISFLNRKSIYLLFSWDLNKEYLHSWEKIVTIAATSYNQETVVDQFGDLIDFESIGDKLEHEALHNYIKKYILSIAYLKI